MRRLSAPLLVMVAMLTAAQPVSAATLRVPQDFSSIQQAEDNANPGDLIRISKGTYDEVVLVDESNLRFLGVGGRVIVDAGGLGQDVFKIVADNVTIQNVTLRNGTDDGVRCDGQACTIRSVVVDGDTGDDCVDLASGNNHVVTNSRLVGCGSEGVDVVGAGVRILGNSARLVEGNCFEVTGNNVVVQRNVAQSCESSDGINVNGDNARVDANVIRLAGGFGIVFAAPTQNPVITRNLIQSVQGTGIGFECAVSCGSGLVQHNVVAGTLTPDARGYDLNIAAPGLGTLRILNNTASRTGASGFELDIFDALVRSNLASRAGGDGIEIDGNSDNNQVLDNVALRSRFNGFTLDDDSDNNVLRNNLAERNQQDGFGLIDANTTDNLLDRNTARRNVDDGIDNEGTATDLTDNRSTGSGDRDCVNTGTVDLNTGNRCADGTSFGP